MINSQICGEVPSERDEEFGLARLEQLLTQSAPQPLPSSRDLFLMLTDGSRVNKVVDRSIGSIYVPQWSALAAQTA